MNRPVNGWRDIAEILAYVAWFSAILILLIVLVNASFGWFPPRMFD